MSLNELIEDMEATDAAIRETDRMIKNLKIDKAVLEGHYRAIAHRIMYGSAGQQATSGR